MKTLPRNVLIVSIVVLVSVILVAPSWPRYLVVNGPGNSQIVTGDWDDLNPVFVSGWQKHSLPAGQWWQDRSLKYKSGGTCRMYFIQTRGAVWNWFQPLDVPDGSTFSIQDAFSLIACK